MTLGPEALRRAKRSGRRRVRIAEECAELASRLAPESEGTKLLQFALYVVARLAPVLRIALPFRPSASTRGTSRRSSLSASRICSDRSCALRGCAVPTSNRRGSSCVPGCLLEPHYMRLRGLRRRIRLVLPRDRSGRRLHLRRDPGMLEFRGLLQDLRRRTRTQVLAFRQVPWPRRV